MHTRMSPCSERRGEARHAGTWPPQAAGATSAAAGGSTPLPPMMSGCTDVNDMWLLHPNDHIREVTVDDE